MKSERKRVKGERGKVKASTEEMKHRKSLSNVSLGFCRLLEKKFREREKVKASTEEMKHGKSLSNVSLGFCRLLQKKFRDRKV